MTVATLAGPDPDEPRENPHERFLRLVKEHLPELRARAEALLPSGYPFDAVDLMTETIVHAYPTGSPADDDTPAGFCNWFLAQLQGLVDDIERGRRR